jgi:hypothetical protein
LPWFPCSLARWWCTSWLLPYSSRHSVTYLVLYHLSVRLASCSDPTVDQSLRSRRRVQPPTAKEQGVRQTCSFRFIIFPAAYDTTSSLLQYGKGNPAVSTLSSWRRASTWLDLSASTTCLEGLLPSARHTSSSRIHRYSPTTIISLIHFGYITFSSRPSHGLWTYSRLTTLVSPHGPLDSERLQLRDRLVEYLSTSHHPTRLITGLDNIKAATTFAETDIRGASSNRSSIDYDWARVARQLHCVDCLGPIVGGVSLLAGSVLEPS